MQSIKAYNDDYNNDGAKYLAKQRVVALVFGQAEWENKKFYLCEY